MKVHGMDAREIRIIVTVLLMFLAFVYGVLVVPLGLFPYERIKGQLSIASSVQRAMDIDSYNENIRWVKKAPDTLGLRVNALPETAGGSQDYIVYTTTHDSDVRMIDRHGNVVFTWSVPFDHLWDNQDHIVSLKELGNEYFYARDFHVYDNGDLLVMMTAGGITPWGVGMARVDKNSQVVWTYNGYVNNDFEVAPDGTIYAVEHEIREENLETIELEVLPFLEDNIVIIDPDTGHEIKRISLIDALDRSIYADILKQMESDRNLGDSGDPTHSNSIAYIAQDHPTLSWMKAGYLMISVRNLNAMVVLDPETEEITYAVGLQTRMQHDFDVLPNGNVLIFDNRGSFTRGGYTRVVEVDPVMNTVVWSYDPHDEGYAEDDIFDSKFWGAQQRLANGHTMIAYAEGGRLMEVLPTGDLVWDYAIPLTKTLKFGDLAGEEHIAVVTSFEVFDSQALPFVKQ